MIRSVLITGANAGLGREVARQLAAHDEIGRIHLACRDAQKGEAARADLESKTGRAIFDVVVLDTTDLKSVRSAAESLPQPVDALVMNAGGFGGGDPLQHTPDGATLIFAANVLGHVALLEALLAEQKLTSTALYVGSEAARGVWKLGIRRPTFATSSADELATVVDGTSFRGRTLDVMLAYAQVKYLAALWMGAVARRHPELRCATVSPGNTAGTEAAEDLPLPLRILMRHVIMRIGPFLGLAHPLETGARRIVDAITDDRYAGGTFYASRANAIVGPMIDQADIRPDLRDHAVQDNADEAIHRFLA